MHLNDGQLRTYLDGEQTGSADSQILSQHLANCAVCQTRLDQLSARIKRVQGRLATVAPHIDDPRLAARPALTNFRIQTASRLRKEQDRMSVKNNLLSTLFLRWRPVLVGLIALVLAVGLFTFPPARQTFSAFLSLFRVQRITVVEVDSTRLGDLAGDAPLGKRIGQLMSDTVTFTKKPADPQVVDSAEEAGQKAGFPVRLFKDSPTGAPPRLTVQDSAVFNFVIDRARAQAILDETGYADLKLPEEIDGARVEVNIPVAVAAAYGDCPTDRADEGEGDPLPPDELKNCILLAQTPGPTVDAPPELDMTQLAQIGLQILGMTPEEARNFSQTVDWTSTLVVPIPRNGHRYEQVEVDGVTGNLIYRQADDGMPERYTILWVKNNLVYGLAAFGDPADGVKLANSLP